MKMGRAATYGVLSLAVAASALVGPARGQTAATSTRVDPYQGGAAPAFSSRAAAAAASATAGASGATNSGIQASPTGFVDPLRIDPLTYAMAGSMMPMTRTQAGLSAAASVQNMTGIGSGRLSGVRGPGSVQQPKATAALAHKPKPPGGDASRYFHRFSPKAHLGVPAPTPAAAASTASSRRFFSRADGFFPQTGR